MVIRPTSLHYIGAQRGIETASLPETPYPHTFLDVVGVQRRVARATSPSSPKLVRATRHGAAAAPALRPRVVVSVGGYASLPAVLAARRLRIPVVVVSFDRRPGRASALAARFAAASAVDVRRIIVAPRRGDRRAGAPDDPRRRPGRRTQAARADARVAGRSLRPRRDRRLARLGCAERGHRSTTPPSTTATPTSRSTTSSVSASPRRSAAATAGERASSTASSASRSASTWSTPPPTSSSAAAVRPPWPRSPSPARRRSSSRGPAAAEDHQTENVRWLADRGGADAPARASALACSARRSTSCAPIRCGSATLGGKAAAAGAAHRRGASRP